MAPTNQATPQNEDAPDTAANGPGHVGTGKNLEGDCGPLVVPVPVFLPSIRSQRQRRVLLALLEGAKTREQLDRIAGSSNSPDVVLKMRRRFGLDLPCTLEKVQDRDGRSVERGSYSLTPTDALTARRLMEQGGRP